MLIETERLIITEFTMDMAQVVQENSVDEDNKRFVPDEVWESIEEVEETLEFLISQYGSFEGPLVYPIIVKENNDNVGYVQLVPIHDGMWELGYHIAKAVILSEKEDILCVKKSQWNILKQATIVLKQLCLHIRIC